MGLLAALNGGTSCTATAAVGNHNNTTAVPKQRSEGVSGRIPPSTFSTNCGDCQSNASSLLDRPVVTMAPAVTEPLSPTEKLPSSTASPTATSTRSSSKKHQQELTDSSNATTATITDNASATSSAGERKSRHSAAISPTTSPRLTRSKDAISAADTVIATAAAAAYQSVFEQAVTQSPAAVDPSSSGEGYETKTKINNIRNNNNNNTNNNNNNKSSNNNKNDEMGLSTAAPSSNKKHNNNNNNKSSSINNNNNSSCGTSSTIRGATGSPSAVVSHSTPPIAHPLNCRADESTAQLLADLTDDFEETITAEICLRNQLAEVNLDKGSVADSPTSRSSSSSTRPPLPTLQLSSEHMATPATVPAVECRDQQDEEQQQRHQDQHPDDGEGDISNDTAQFSLEEQDMVTTAESQSDNSATQVEIQSVEELPPISTDSTMTASEAEDNLEERLSQLDGSAVDANSPGAPASAICEMVPATLPRTPQQQQQSHGSDHLLLEQLQQTESSVLNASVASATAATTVGSQPQTTHDMDDPDIMEVFKVLNTLDDTAGTEALTELNSLFNEVYTTLNCEEMGASGSGHQQHNQQNAAAIGALATPSTVALSPAKTSPIKELHAEIERKQLSMQRKIDFMLRRLRKTQARYMCNHVSEEIAGIFEYLARGDGLKVQQPINQLVKIKSEQSDAPSDASGGEGIAPAAVAAAAVSASSVDDLRMAATKMLSSRPPPKVWTDERKTPVPSSQVCAFLRKLEASATAQQLCTSSQGVSPYYNSTPARKPRKADIASSTSSASGVQQRPQVVPILEPLVAEELMHVSGLLRSSLREVQLAVDSDATESSSGGESADEMITYNNQLQQPLAITKRAAWRYSRDRAAIASRWSWLLSQIADLEIKIRQHSELHQEIIRAKHAAVHGKSGAAATMSMSASSAALLMKGPTSTSVNGFKGDLSMLVLGDAAASEEEEDPNALPGSCRTRGYSAEQFRKRKLLQTTNIHTISKKAARPSTIKCGCQWPQHPCALCTGRPDPTAPRDLLDTMMMSERVALVDPGYHPVLSFPGDVSNTLHFEAIARQSDWQHRVFRCQAKSIAKSVWRAEREAIAGGHHYSSKKYGSAGDMQPIKRRYIKKKDRLNEERMRGAAADRATASTASATVKQEQTQLQDGMSPDAGFDLEGDGNGIGTMTTPSGTPLVVANRPTKNGKKLNHPLMANGLLLSQRSPAANNKTSISNSYIHQTSDCPPKSYDRYNPSQAHSSLISSSSKNNKYRKYTHHNNHLNSNSGKNNKHKSSQHQQNYRQQHYNSNNSSNPSQHYSTMNGGGDATNFQQTNPWDYPMGRSRPSSPTPQSGYGYFQKVDRLFDRKNRASYDIDNVVIPYCLATTSRAEVLPYKEIPTPKWRVFDINKDDDELDEDGNPQQTSDECDPAVENVENEKVATCSNSDLHTANNSQTVTTMENKANDSESTPRMSNIQIVDAVTPGKTKDDMAPPMEVGEPQSQSSPTISAPLSPPQAAAIAAVTNTDESSDEPAAKKIKIDPAIEELHVVGKQEEKKVEASPKMTIAPVASKDWRPALRRISDAHKLTIDELEEDISYEAMVLRHERALDEERRKFQTFLKFPWSTRSRANRRIDSRAESSGANTPDPTSPALQTPNIGGGDHESIPSPLAPSTQSLETISETAYVTNALHAPLTASQGGHRSERRRTTSAKKVGDLERRSSTPDPKEPPYESLRFPLSDDVYESLMRLMPSDYQNHDSKCSENDSSFSADASMGSVLPLTRVTRSNRGILPMQITVKTEKICDQNSSATATATSTGTATATDTNVSASPKPYENGMAAAVQTDADNNVNESVADDEAVEQMEAHAPDNDDDEEDEEEEDEDYADADDADEDDADADEDDADADEDEEEDEDYQRHPFAPLDDLSDGAGTDVAMRDVGVGESLAGGIAAVDTDGDTDMEPFQDDDPNDPEWKGETAVRIERPRNKL